MVALRSALHLARGGVQAVAAAATAAAPATPAKSKPGGSRFQSAAIGVQNFIEKIIVGTGQLACHIVERGVKN